MNLYLTRHQYKNTFTEDLWRALGEASGKPIEQIMSTWTLQMGYPVVTIRRRGREITATQGRFLFNPRANHTEEFTSPYGFETIDTFYFLETEPFSICHSSLNE